MAGTLIEFINAHDLQSFELTVSTIFDLIVGCDPTRPDPFMPGCPILLCFKENAQQKDCLCIQVCDVSVKGDRVARVSYYERFAWCHRPVEDKTSFPVPCQVRSDEYIQAMVARISQLLIATGKLLFFEKVGDNQYAIMFKGDNLNQYSLLFCKSSSDNLMPVGGLGYLVTQIVALYKLMRVSLVWESTCIGEMWNPIIGLIKNWVGLTEMTRSISEVNSDPEKVTVAQLIDFFKGEIEKVRQVQSD